MKNDFGGHDNHHYDNIYAYVGHALGVTNTLSNDVDVFTGNKAVITGNNVGGPQCPGKKGNPATIMANNSYYTPTGKVTECGKPLAQSGDMGSTVAKTPTDATIIGWASAKLGIKD